jgi:hypothetical protein
MYQPVRLSKRPGTAFSEELICSWQVTVHNISVSVTFVGSADCSKLQCSA